MARTKGAKNKIGARVKDNVETVFNRLGGVDHMVDWAQKNMTDFYKIYAKLLPSDVTVTHERSSIEEYVETLDADEFRSFADGIKRLAVSAGDRKEAKEGRIIN